MRKLRRIANNVISMFGSLAIFTGIVICMCESQDAFQQFFNWFTGIGMMIIGALIALIANTKESESEYGWLDY